VNRQGNVREFHSVWRVVTMDISSISHDIVGLISCFSYIMDA